MMTTPKISIIFPVYNVELYLRQGLDSAINQTLRDIQIICVNDGSTDGSLGILREYANKDSRIEIIDQENQGAGSARNAAFPFINGKYAYFADPDDWLDLKLCEKAYAILEETKSDVAVIKNTRNGEENEFYSFDPKLPKIRHSPSEKRDLLMKSQAPWRKIWTTCFLIENMITFCEGKRPYNDNVQNWRGIVLAKQIAILDEPLYNYRIRLSSYQTHIDKSHFAIVKTMSELGHFLKKSGYYPLYKNMYHRRKLLSAYYVHRKISRELRRDFGCLIRENLTEEDREFLRAASDEQMPKKIKLFYRMIEGGLLDAIKYNTNLGISDIVKFPERVIRHAIIKPLKKRLKAA